VRPWGGDYGTEDGTSYANAWEGLENVIWGPGGVQAGDTLYVCGLHITTYTGGGVEVNIGPIASGTSENNRVIIRGDYAGDKGIIWQATKISHEAWTYEGSNTYSVTIPAACYRDWFFEDITPDTWKILRKESSLAVCQATPGSHYSVDYSAGSKLYIHCSDGGDPTDRIYMNRWGYNFRMDEAQYVTFLNLEFYCIYRMFIDRTGGDWCAYVKWEGCKLWYAEHSTIDFRDASHHIEFINCDIAWAQNGIVLAENIDGGGNPPHDFIFRGNYFHDIGVRTTDLDAHGIAGQGSYNWVIENNEFYNCGTGPLFYAYQNTSIRNITIRWNYIHDTYTSGGATGYGIAFNCNGNARAEKSGVAVYGNIVTNCTVGYRYHWEEYQATFYNNVAYNCSEHSFWIHRNDYGQNVKLRNNISLNPGEYHIVFSTNFISPGDYVIDSDHNLFYPISGDTFFFHDATGGGARTFNDWQAISKSGCTTDFQLQNDSLAIDTGTDVGLNQDYAGTSVPLGFAPDIGTFECVKPIYLKISATPRFGDVPLVVNYKADIIGNNSPFNYTWDFGDGTSSNIQNPTHTYSIAGEYVSIFSVTDTRNNQETNSLTITAFDPIKTLNITAITGIPAPGAGGTTNPPPGVHQYARGSSVNIEAIPNADYRFSRWSGDVIDSDVYNGDINILLDTDKAISAYFCTECGDVNGDSIISPADAQAAFDLFLGRYTSPSEFQMENADVNCDGTQSKPNVTPADAQAIFDKYLGKSELPCNCSNNSRSGIQKIRSVQPSEINIILNDRKVEKGHEIFIPIILSNALNIKAFGFDLLFPSDSLEFIAMEKAGLSIYFQQIDANELASGLLRVGGYCNKAITIDSPEVLIILIFKARKRIEQITPFLITNTFDDIHNSFVKQER